jgi:hypothetical protein
LTHRKVEPAPELQIELARKASVDARERKPVKVKQDPKHTPEYWEEHYREKYGDQAKRVGWGRMVHERAKDMDPKEVLQILNQASINGVPGVAPHLVMAARVDAGTAFVDRDEKAIAGARVIAQHLQLCRGQSMPRLRHDPEFRSDVDHNAKFWEAWCHQKRDLPSSTAVEELSAGYKDRARYSPALDAVLLSKKSEPWVVVHEYGHALEYQHAHILDLRAFIAARVGSERLQKLSDLLPGHGFEDWELTRPDEFYSFYIGKDYAMVATELLSTVVGDLANGGIKHILDKDPETLYYILGFLLGE